MPQLNVASAVPVGLSGGTVTLTETPKGAFSKVRAPANVRSLGVGLPAGLCACHLASSVPTEQHALASPTGSLSAAVQRVPPANGLRGLPTAALFIPHHHCAAHRPRARHQGAACRHQQCTRPFLPAVKQADLVLVGVQFPILSALLASSAATKQMLCLCSKRVPGRSSHLPQYNVTASGVQKIGFKIIGAVNVIQASCGVRTALCRSSLCPDRCVQADCCVGSASFAPHPVMLALIVSQSSPALCR